MTAVKLISFLSVLTISLSVSPVFAVNGINDSNHPALASYYETQVKETEAKLQKIKHFLKHTKLTPITTVDKDKISVHIQLPIFMNMKKY